MVLNVQASTVPITITPSSLAFGDQVAGTMSAPQTATYLNGTTVPVNVQTVSITGSNAADFTIVSDGCQGSILSPGVACGVNVAFAPATNDIGTLQANLVFTDDQIGSPRSIPLTGTATVPAPLACPSSSTTLNFSNQLIGVASPPLSITITNCGSTDLHVSSVSINGSAAADFSVVGNTCTGVPVTPGSTCTLTLVFTPAASGTRQANLVIIDDAASSPTTIGLVGSGTALVPAICFSANPINFGNVGVDSTSRVQNITITNCGTAPLDISGITITGANTGDFIIVTNACSTVVSSSVCTVGLEFVPTAGGSRSADLSISDNIFGSPQLVALLGSGSLSQPDAAIGRNTNLRAMKGFGIITNAPDSAEEVVQNVPLVTPKLIQEGRHGVTFYVAVKNVGTGSDQFSIQGQQIGGGSGFTANYFLGSSTRPSETVDVTAAVQAGTFMTTTLAAGAVTGDSTMIRVVIYADKTIVTRSTTATFILTFTSASNPSQQDTVVAAVVAR
jgi:hypothetical protein